jgi:MYXO-CTERM domain-containing protein
VSLGADIVVESVEVGADGTLQVRYAVATNAALGTRDVTVDDGVRLYSGVALEVSDNRAPSARTCGSPVAPAAALAGIALTAALGRRRRRVAAAPLRT